MKKSTSIPYGAHLLTPIRLGFGFQHHGIYVGNGKVVHLLSSGEIKKESLFDEFLTKSCTIRHHEGYDVYSPDRIVDRARDSIGKKMCDLSHLSQCEYNASKNNCEDFCMLCITGKPCSNQAERRCDNRYDKWEDELLPPYPWRTYITGGDPYF